VAANDGILPDPVPGPNPIDTLLFVQAKVDPATVPPKRMALVLVPFNTS